MVFSRASCPAYTITTNGETGFDKLSNILVLMLSGDRTFRGMRTFPASLIPGRVQLRKIEC